MKTNATQAGAAVVDPDYTVTTVKALKPGAFFKLTPTHSSTVYIRGAYARSLGKYECEKFDDMNSLSYFKGDRKCYTDFTF